MKRQSIEDQNRAGHITDLWIAGKIADDDSLVQKLRIWLAKIDTPVAEKKAGPDEVKAKKTGGKAPSGENEAPPLKNVGELFARAAKFGLSTRDVFEAVGVGTREEIIDFNEAWIATAKKYANTIKSVQEGSK